MICISKALSEGCCAEQHAEHRSDAEGTIALRTKAAQAPTGNAASTAAQQPSESALLMQIIYLHGVKILNLHGWHTSAHCAMVNKTWKQAADDWRRQQTHLDHINCSNIKDGVLHIVAKQCHGLHTLIVRGCSAIMHLENRPQPVSDVAIKAVAQACPQLERLCVAHSDVETALWAVAQGSGQLKELDVSHNSVFNSAIQAVAQAYPQLKSLNVSYCCHLRDEAIISVALGCRQLECLDVSGLHLITDAAIHAVAQGCPQLKELDMTQCAMLTESASVSAHQSCTHLECLRHSLDYGGRAVRIQYYP